MLKFDSNQSVNQNTFFVVSYVAGAHKLHIHTTQVSSSRKWLYALQKSDLQSIVQSAVEFHDRNLPEIEHVLFLPVSSASFMYQNNGARNPVHTGKFSGARNLRQKLAPETFQSECGFIGS